MSGESPDHVEQENNQSREGEPANRVVLRVGLTGAASTRASIHVGQRR